MDNIDVCLICGAHPATQYFGHSPFLPLCSNWACEQALIAELNEDPNPIEGAQS